MAFDIYLEEEVVYIDHHEETLFELVYEDEKYPQLNWIWEMFYDGPVISSVKANELVHELIQLRNQIEKKREQKYLIAAIDRIMPLLSKAYKTKKQLKCMSD